MGISHTTAAQLNWAGFVTHHNSPHIPRIQDLHGILLVKNPLETLPH